MNEFYNPFHFVPVAKPQLELMPREALHSAPPQREKHTHDHVTHDRYVANSYSGRIICRLKGFFPESTSQIVDLEMPVERCNSV